MGTIRHGLNTGMGMAERNPKNLATIMHHDRLGALLDDLHVVNLPDSADTSKHESKFPKGVPRFDPRFPTIRGTNRRREFTCSPKPP
jgi:hypothetical protein